MNTKVRLGKTEILADKKAYGGLWRLPFTPVPLLAAFTRERIKSSPA